MGAEGRAAGWEGGAAGRGQCEEVGEGQLCRKGKKGRLMVRAGQRGGASGNLQACSSVAGGALSPFMDEKTEAQRG